MDRSRDDARGDRLYDPYVFEGDGDDAHMAAWESDVPEELLADAHEALSRFYNKALKRSLRKEKKKGWQ